MEIRKLGGGGMVGLSGGKTGRNSEVNMFKIHCAKFSKIIEKNHVNLNLEILQYSKYSLET